MVMSRLRGFTLIEILVVVVIIAMLIGMLIPVIGLAQRHAKEATCQMNLHEIYQGISQYWQDHSHTYPRPDKPLGELVTEGKLSGIKTCPMDPTDKNDSYGECYNYYGYGAQPTPTPLTALPSSDGWVNGSLYQPLGVTSGKNIVVLNNDPKQAYVCTQAHTASADTKPGSGSSWQQYWQQLPELWWGRTGLPDTAYTGLVNGSAPSSTIITVCIYHTAHSQHYTVLRVNGDVEFFAPTANDAAFWSICKPNPKQ